MNVLSLCDGISCGRIALKRMGYRVDKYYASEINGNLEASIFKQLVSGEPVEARLPYGQPFILKQYAKMPLVQKQRLRKELMRLENEES